MGWFVYMLENGAKTKFYTGMTNDLERRVGEHNGVGGAKATRPGRPWTLVYQRPYGTIKMFPRSRLNLRLDDSGQ